MYSSLRPHSKEPLNYLDLLRRLNDELIYVGNAKHYGLMEKSCILNKIALQLITY